MSPAIRHQSVGCRFVLSRVPVLDFTKVSCTPGNCCAIIGPSIERQVEANLSAGIGASGLPMHPIVPPVLRMLIFIGKAYSSRCCTAQVRRRHAPGETRFPARAWM